MTTIEVLLLTTATVLVVSVVVAFVLVEAHAMLVFPRLRFNALLPRLLNTSAVTILGWCFIRRHYISGHLRAHEQYHHLCAVEMGRWRHLWRYVWTFFQGLRRYGLATVPVQLAPTPATEQLPSKTYLCAYWLHPEEVAARAYADQNAHVYADVVVQIR